MDCFVLAVTIFLSSILTNAQNNDTSVTRTSWFWPLLGLSLAILISVPLTIILLSIAWYCQKQSNNNAETSSSASSTPVQHVRRQHRSHFAGGFRTPPPPYTTTERRSPLFVTSSLPPPYEDHIEENPPPPPTTRVADTPSVLTNASIETFQA